MGGRRRAAAATVAAVIALALAGCSPEPDEDCDAEDLRHREPECGYYDGDTWVLYPWVAPGVGGKPPSGEKPKPPKDATAGNKAPARTSTSSRR